MLEVENGNVLLVGSRNFNHDIKYAIVWKLDPNGNTIWTKEMSPLPDELRAAFNGIIPDGEGNYLAYGYRVYKDQWPSSAHYFLATVQKLDSLGNRLWVKDHTPNQVYDAGWNKLIPSTDGNYILAGFENELVFYQWNRLQPAIWSSRKNEA